MESVWADFLTERPTHVSKQKPLKVKVKGKKDFSSLNLKAVEKLSKLPNIYRNESLSQRLSMSQQPIECRDNPHFSSTLATFKIPKLQHKKEECSTDFKTGITLGKSPSMPQYQQKSCLSIRNRTNTLSCTRNSLKFDLTKPLGYSMDPEYDQSQIGPGTYDAAKWSTFEIIAQKQNSNIHKIKPCFTFGKGIRNNNSQFFSKSQWHQEKMLQSSAAVGTYNPNDSFTKPNLVRDLQLSTSSTRFDEMTFKKKAEASPGAVYNVSDPRDVNYREKYRNQPGCIQSTFGKGNRIPPKKVELKPSPCEYNIKSNIDLNKNKAPLIARPRHSYIDKIWNESIQKGKDLRAKHQGNLLNQGPGQHIGQKLRKGLLSQSKSLKEFSFGNLERKYDYIKQDKQIQLGPGQYFTNSKVHYQTRAENVTNPKKTLINSSRVRSNDFDIRKNSQYVVQQGKGKARV